MTKHILLPLLIGCAMHTQAQHARIVVQHAGNVLVYTDLEAAIIAAPANSDLYLSGGTFLVPGGFALDKTLHFIGAGINNDSTNATGATILTTNGTAHFRLTSGASGSSFTGIRFSTPGSNNCLVFGTAQGDQSVVSVEFLRCAFNQRVMLGVQAPSEASSAFTECIFHNLLNGYNGTAQFTRCIFDHQAGTGAEVSGFLDGGLTMLNCVGLGTRVGDSPGAMIANCVFTRSSAPFWQSSGSTLLNNLLVSNELVINMSGHVHSGNILNVPVGAIFVSEGDGKYQFSDDLHLQPGCPGVGAGNDGTDMGIYGSASPYKDGAAPHTPHFQRVGFAGGTNAAGNLPVQVRVAAQAN